MFLVNTKFMTKSKKGIKKSPIIHNRVKRGLFLIILDGILLIAAALFNFLFDYSNINLFGFIYIILSIASNVFGLVGLIYCTRSGSTKFKKSGIFKLIALGVSILSIALPKTQFSVLFNLANDICNIFFVSFFIKGCGEVSYSLKVKKLQKFVSYSRLCATLFNFGPTLMRVFNYSNPIMFSIFSSIVFITRFLHQIAFIILVIAAYKTIK